MGRSGWEEGQAQIDSALADSLAPFVDGSVLAAATVRLGSYRLGLSRINPLTGGWLLPTIFGEERHLPLVAIAVVTSTDIYLFRGDQRGEDGPLRRWPRAALRNVELRPFGNALRVFLTLESGKKAVMMFRADNSSKATRDRVRAAFGDAADGSYSAPSSPALAPAQPTNTGKSSQSLGSPAPAHDWLDPGETLKLRMAEMPPALFWIPPFSLLLIPTFKLIRGWRALCVTDRNLYVVRGSGDTARVLFRAPLGQFPVEPGGSGIGGRYLTVADQKIWQLATPESIQPELAVANGGAADAS